VPAQLVGCYRRSFVRSGDRVEMCESVFVVGFDFVSYDKQGNLPTPQIWYRTYGITQLTCQNALVVDIAMTFSNIALLFVEKHRYLRSVRHDSGG